MEASKGQPEEAASQTIQIHVVSPSAEVPDKLTFTEVPIKTTISEMKKKIQEAVATHPGPERQRIIYRGRALVHQDMTLEALLGVEAIANSESHNLHLVLTPTATPTSANHTHQEPVGLPNLPSNFNAAPPRPASTSQLPDRNSNNTHAPLNLNTSPNPMLGAQQVPQQGPLPNIRNQFMQAGRPIFPGQQPFGFPNMAAFGPNLNLPIPGAPMPMPWAQNQNMQGGVGTLPQMPPVQPGSRAQSTERGQIDRSRRSDPSTTSRNATPSPSNGQTNPFQAPTPPGTTINRSQWRISVNQSYTAPSPAQGGQHLPNTSPNVGLPQNAAHLHNLHQLNQIQNMLVASMSNRYPPPRVGASMAPQASSSQTVYLLSSPTGPEALLLSPMGAFATPGYPTGAFASPLANIQPQPSTMARMGLQPRDLLNHQPHANNAVDPALPDHAHQARANPGQNQQQDQLGDFVRILLPLGGHLWLLIRLCGFVYLFSSGSGWRNTILLGICAFIVFVAQTRILEPLVQNIWNPIREHVEGLIQANPPPAPARNANTAESRDGGTPQSPQQLANRLLEERRAQQGPIRRAFMQAERSIALFIASLVPGLGERQVAARQEAARQQREREETAQREEEERQRRELEGKQDASGGTEQSQQATTVADSQSVNKDRELRDGVLSGNFSD